MVFIPILEGTDLAPETASAACVTASSTKFPVCSLDVASVTLALIGRKVSGIDHEPAQY